MITLQEAEAIVGEPAERWVSRCHEISMKLAPHVDGIVRRGFFMGETTSPVFQHSWIELPDGSVLDPTVHAFTNRPPLWHGPADEYDIGGCRLSGPAGPPPDFYASESEPVELNIAAAAYVANLLHLDPTLWNDEDGGWVLCSIEQLFWLANLPVKDEEREGVLCRFFAAEVYEAIIEAGHRGAIPIDRRKWILKEEY